MGEEIRVRLKVTSGGSGPVSRWPVTRGIPIPKGTVCDLSLACMLDPDGEPVPTQIRTLCRWPDGGPKWVLVDFQADLPESGKAEYTFTTAGPKMRVAPDTPVRVHQESDRLVVTTGRLRFSVNRASFGYLEDVALGKDAGKDGFVPEATFGSGSGEAWVLVNEARRDEEGNRFVYGLAGDCPAHLDTEEYEVSVEEEGPLRTVIRCAGAFEADLPMHHYAGYRPFRYITRITAYAGLSTLRIFHTLVMTCNARETQLVEAGLSVPVGMEGALRCRIGAPNEIIGDLASGTSVVLSQQMDNHYRVDREEGRRRRTVAEGVRCAGWLAVENDCSGVAVGLRHMAEAYPTALGASDRGIEIYPWRDPDGKPLSYRRYAEAVSWDQGEGVYSDGMGSAKSSELFLHYYPSCESSELPRRIERFLDPPNANVDPEWMARCGVTGGFGARDADRFPESEETMSGFADWLVRNIRSGRWYGSLNWGDVLAAWEASEGDWRFFGRWGWCNSEWDPRHGLWIHYLRTGDHYAVAEAMTRHSMDVDTCHWHPLRPYMVGGCFRHSVDHFGDETCASHTFLDNWVDYYYLTGDLRTLEVLREAGGFFVRFRWSEDPRFSFSLRGIANALRGLLYVYEVTGERAFLDRAEQVYEVVARGQNEDGSWHKRFQVSTSNRLPHQAPYGMATEGTTLAVESGTAEPFTEREFQTLRGGDRPVAYVLTPEEQKGYQTHYLMIGLDLLHRLTGREDVAKAYLKAVDWFCGGPGVWDVNVAYRERYGGVVCRHLGYAHRLTGERRYLEIGRHVLERLIDGRDRSEDPKRRGAVSLSPTHLSTFFFGVPLLLGELKSAEMAERADG